MPSLIDAGYAVVQVAPSPFKDKAPDVVDICSVSDCLSHRPENWINAWLHNDLGWFNNAADAHCLLPSLDAAIATARRFSVEQPEPGDYYVIEVLEGSVSYPEPDLSEFHPDPPAPGEPDLIEEYKEWIAHRYDPGHYLGGTIEPHLRKYALGPRGRMVAAALLGVSALTPLLFLPFASEGSGERVMAALWALFLGFAAWRMTRP